MDNLYKRIILSPFNLMYGISPKITLGLLFRYKQGYTLNLKNPQTYNEKLQWIKLYDKNPLMPKCCDKYAVRNYVDDRGASEILNELYWEGTNPDDIPFDSFPEKFVIKVTHGSSFNIICKNKDTLDKKESIRKIKKWLREKFLPCYGEWFYGQETPRIIAERYLESDDGQQLRDYKVFCFHGRPVYIRVDSDRFTEHKTDVFTANWERLERVNMGFPCSYYKFEKPQCLEDMLKYSRILSEPFLHARVDFYIIQNRLYFGEITFTNGAGFDKFHPFDFDMEMGRHIHLPSINH